MTNKLENSIDEFLEEYEYKNFWNFSETTKDIIKDAIAKWERVRGVADDTVYTDGITTAHISNPDRGFVGADMVNNQSNYKYGGIETIDLIKAFLTPEEWRGYLKGTLYANRDRAPYKGQTEQDYEKAVRYWEWLKEAMGETK